MSDLGGKTKAVEPAGREHDGVELRVRRACAAGCRCSRASGSIESVRLEREQLGPAPRRGRADRASPAGAAIAPQSASRGSSRDEVGADGQPGGVSRGHVLGGVDGGVDAPVEQRLLELLYEDAAVADLAEGATSVAVAGGRDRHERDLPPRGTEPLGDERGLRQREPAAAGAEPEKHYSSGSRRSNR